MRIKPKHFVYILWLVLLSSQGLLAQSPTLVSYNSSSASSAGPTTFTISASPGAAAINSLQLLIAWSPTAANTCYVIYIPSAGVYLGGDPGPAKGPITPGSGTLQNSQCTLNGAATTVSNTNNTLSISVVLSFDASFVGTMGVYGLAADTAGNSTGIQQVSTYTTTAASAQPPTTSATPSSGVALSQTFTVSAQDVNGWKYISQQALLIGPSSTNLANSCYVLMGSGNGGTLYLRDDANTVWQGPIYLNTTGTLRTNQCTISAAASTMTTTPTSISFAINVTFAYTGGYPIGQTENVYLDTFDQAGHEVFAQTGTFTIGPPSPTLGPASASPVSGSGPTTFSVSALDGTAGLSSLQLLVGWSPTAANTCYVMYIPSVGLYLSGDPGPPKGPVAPQSAGSLQNGQCTLNTAATTVSSVGNYLTINPVLTFDPSFVGNMGVYVYASDSAGNNSGVQQVSTYTPAAPNPQAPTGSVTSAPGLGMSQTFVISAQDVNGWKYIQQQLLLIGPNSSSGANSCYMLFGSVNGGAIYLRDDSDTQWTGPIYLNSPATLSNHQCTISSGASSMTPNVTNLTFRLSVTFQGTGGFPIGQTQNVYLDTFDQTGVHTGLQPAGTWTVAPAVSISQSTVTAAPASVVADGASSSAITVTLKDANGNPVSGRIVTLSQAGGHSTISPASGTSDVSGVFSFTVQNLRAETVTYTATDITEALTLAQTAPVTFLAGPVSTTQSTVSASPASVPADGSSASTITVTFKDSNGNPVSGKTAALSQGTGHSIISAASGLSNAAGVVTFPVKDTVAEVVTYSATDTSDNLAFAQPATVTFVPGPVSASQSTVAASPASQTANGSTPSTITVTLRDANSNAVSGKTVTLGQTGQSTISTASGASNGSGVVTFTVKDTVVETATYHATDFTDGIAIAQPASVNFTAPLGTVAAPTITPGSGTYTATQTITLSTSTPGATVCYTTDGTTPTESSTVYRNPITVAAPVKIIAMAYQAGWMDSPISSASFYFTNPTGGTGPTGSGSGTPPTDSGNGLDPRRVGVRNFGAYWGAAGEQIDTTSGNLNFSLPLLKVLSRGGWSVNVMLNYNSQMWRQDSAGTWLMGYDVGYGLAWQLQIGSLFPVYSSASLIDHYLYTDATGAEYTLTNAGGSLWTSPEGVFITYDDQTKRIYAPDGSFRVMGSVSSGGEQDAGTMYPTLIQDSNGNQIQIAYAPGAGAGTATNTSARIQYIYDPRAPHYHPADPLTPTYYFTYQLLSSTDTIPHLASIVGQPGESYSFAYINQALNAPATNASYGVAALLQTLTVQGLSASHTFLYTNSGEMSKVTTPMGGVLTWTYAPCSYAGGISLREVNTRSMTATFSNSWNFTHDDSCGGTQTYHAVTTISDTGAGSKKKYTAGSLFNNTRVLPTQYDELNSNGTRNLSKQYGWTQAAAFTYMNQVTTSLDPDGANLQSKTVQTLDGYGNLSQSQAFDYGNTSGTPDRTYDYTYLTDANYTSLYIRNRLRTATVTAGASKTYLVGLVGYDGVPCNLQYIVSCGMPQDQPGLVLHDPSYDTNFRYRGNPTMTLKLSGNNYMSYQITGAVTTTQDDTWNTLNITPDPNSGLPQVLIPNGNGDLQTTVQYASFWAVQSVTGPNSAQTTTNYDSWGRPSDSTTADGAKTTYTYSYNPNVQLATNDTGQWKKTILDGFGRVTSVQTGHDTTTVSQVDTQYAACACSPLGKLWRVSLPYAPGGTQAWTTYTYDGSGRTLTITKPDGASVTRYAYSGNNTTVTDPAGKWKKFTTDSFGNLTMVTEPDPNNLPSGTVATNYTYNEVNQLMNVDMPRPEGRQTRTFQYTGTDLYTATNPENGTVTYQYDAAHHVTLRTDAKGQQTKYTYDAYGRLTLTQHWIPVGNPPTPVHDASQDVTYYYDTNTLAAGFSQNTWGRLAAVSFGSMAYMYSYNPAGRITTQRLRYNFQAPSGTVTSTDFDAAYTWDNRGRMTSLATPGSGPVYAYQFDNMGRLNGMTENGTSMATAAYTAAGQIFQLKYDNLTETRTYNSLLQLARLTTQQFNNFFTTVMDMQYTYPTANNGRIAQSTDYVAGETVNYTYDALNRLSTAGSTNGSWSQSYLYDGFGNLTGMNGAVAYPVDPTSNRLIIPQGNYDANGLPSTQTTTNVWDVENRLVQQGTLGTNTLWGYDPNGKRVQQTSLPAQNSANVYEPTIYFYSFSGQKIATFTSSWDGANNLNWTPQSRNLYFAGKLIRSNNYTVATDRLGSVRYGWPMGPENQINYLPYGQERTSTADGREKFGTYFRDGQGQDYADQRYYNQAGRFFSPDPGGIKTANPMDPGSWNRYAYAQGDPVNYVDPRGTNRLMCDEYTDYGCAGSPGFDPSAGYFVNWYWGEGGGWLPSGVVYFRSPGGPGDPIGAGGGADPDPGRDFCDPNDPTNARIFSFIADNQAAADSVSKATGLSSDLILAWAGMESTYGTSSAATQDNNFFGLIPALGKNEVHWAGSDQYADCKVRPYDCFASQPQGLGASATSALTSFGGKYLTAALGAQNSGGLISTIAQAIANAGFNSEYGPGVYGGKVQQSADSIKLRKDCNK